MPNPMDPQDAGYYDDSMELELTKQEWEIMVGALIVLSSSRLDGSDAKVVRALSDRLEPYRYKGRATILV